MLPTRVRTDQTSRLMGASTEEIRTMAQNEGMIPLAADALRLVEEGKTSLSEVLSTFGVPLR